MPYSIIPHTGIGSHGTLVWISRPRVCARDRCTAVGLGFDECVGSKFVLVLKLKGNSYGPVVRCMQLEAAGRTRSRACEPGTTHSFLRKPSRNKGEKSIFRLQESKSHADPKLQIKCNLAVPSVNYPFFLLLPLLLRILTPFPPAHTASALPPSQL